MKMAWLWRTEGSLWQLGKGYETLEVLWHFWGGFNETFKLGLDNTNGMGLAMEQNFHSTLRQTNGLLGFFEFIEWRCLFKTHVTLQFFAP